MDDSDVGFGKWAAPSQTIVEVLHFKGKHKKKKEKIFSNGYYFKEKMTL